MAVPKYIEVLPSRYRYSKDGVEGVGEWQLLEDALADLGVVDWIEVEKALMPGCFVRCNLGAGE